MQHMGGRDRATGREPAPPQDRSSINLRANDEHSVRVSIVDEKSLAVPISSFVFVICFPDSRILWKISAEMAKPLVAGLNEVDNKTDRRR